jgi:hypothetical protein
MIADEEKSRSVPKSTKIDEWDSLSSLLLGSTESGELQYNVHVKGIVSRNEYFFEGL